MIKGLNNKVAEIDKKATEFSKEMSQHEYTITAEKVDIPLKRMKKIVRMMGFKNSETDKIIASVKNDLVGKEMQKGDDFKKLIADAFTKAITEAVTEIKGN
jgi:hypothetical protein